MSFCPTCHVVTQSCRIAEQYEAGFRIVCNAALHTGFRNKSSYRLWTLCNIRTVQTFDEGRWESKAGLILEVVLPVYKTAGGRGGRTIQQLHNSVTKELLASQRDAASCITVLNDLIPFYTDKLIGNWDTNSQWNTTSKYLLWWYESKGYHTTLCVNLHDVILVTGFVGTALMNSLLVSISVLPSPFSAVNSSLFSSN